MLPCRLLLVPVEQVSFEKVLQSLHNELTAVLRRGGEKKQRNAGFQHMFEIYRPHELAPVAGLCSPLIRLNHGTSGLHCRGGCCRGIADLDNFSPVFLTQSDASSDTTLSNAAATKWPVPQTMSAKESFLVCPRNRHNAGGKISSFSGAVVASGPVVRPTERDSRERLGAIGWHVPQN